MAVVEYAVEDRVARITLNRPAKLNAINLEMRDELLEAFRDFDARPDAWAAVITGSGGAFSVGLDLAETTEAGTDPKLAASIEELYVFQSRIRKPMLALIDGFCLAQGGGIALACDIRIASERAKFGWPQAKRGISSMSGPAMLSIKIPLNYALEFLFTGDFIDAGEAHRLHLVNRVVPTDELAATGERYVRKIVANAPLAIRGMKEAAVRGQTLELEERVRLARDLFERNMATRDAAEGLRAFVEKRAPVFNGE